MVYAKAPLGGPAQVLEYLSRYMHRVAISNERLVSLRKCEVSFKVRDNEHLALQVPAPQDDLIESVQAFMLRVVQVDLSRCPHCGTGIMCVIASIAPLPRCANRATGPPP